MIDVEKHIDDVIDFVEDLIRESIDAYSVQSGIAVRAPMREKLRTLLSSAQSVEQEVGHDQLVAMVVEGRARINDMLQNDDGQAYKEARKYIERTDRFFAASQPNGEV